MNRPKRRHTTTDRTRENRLNPSCCAQDLLTPDQEAELGKRSLAGDTGARNALVVHNQRYLKTVVSEFMLAHPSLEFDELVSEGNLGLIRAAEKFDPSRGTRFITYARYWILQALGRFSEQSGLPVRIPEHRADELKRLRAAMQETLSSDPAVLSGASGLDEDTVRLLIPYTMGTLSLDTPARTPSGDEGDTLGEILCSQEADFIGDLCREELKQLLRKLPERNREILMHRYGVFGREQLTLQKISEKYGITRERARQIETRTIDICRCLGRQTA